VTMLYKFIVFLVLVCVLVALWVWLDGQVGWVIAVLLAGFVLQPIVGHWLKRRKGTP
jgi:UPF0716 family protein affecting phage T7 exclusion